MPRIGLVGSRGYVGQELIRAVLRHPELEIAALASTSQAGEPVDAETPELAGRGLAFDPIDPEGLAGRGIELWVLALANGQAKEWVSRWPEQQTRLVDVSADFRTHADWQYGLLEVRRREIAGSRRVSNPGCYATAALLALWPVRELLTDVPVAFGISGYSGAGRTPGARNDPRRLADNLLPYQLTGHNHEIEIRHQLGTAVRLLPHVAGFFRGISLTIRFRLRAACSLDELHERYQEAYAAEPFVVYDREIPEIQQVARTPACRIGGLVTDPSEPDTWVIVSVIDNLLKGAATQAVQNINLMLGLPHDRGLRDE